MNGLDTNQRHHERKSETNKSHHATTGSGGVCGDLIYYEPYPREHLPHSLPVVHVLAVLQKMKSRIRTIIALAVLLIVLGAAAVIALRPDQYHTSERRAAKEQMIEDIKIQVERLDPNKTFEGGAWWDDSFMRFEDGSWIAYRAQCHKVDPKVYDIFIGKGSNGSWYYSTFHFCIGMFMLEGEEQIESLDEFISTYSLKKFDGVSDQALLPTWHASDFAP